MTGRWGTLTSATPAPRKAAANVAQLLCQRLQAALPAGIQEDSNATSPRPEDESRPGVGGKRERRWGQGRAGVELWGCHLAWTVRVSSFLLTDANFFLSQSSDLSFLSVPPFGKLETSQRVFSLPLLGSHSPFLP